jgi:hypothetical protein
MIPEFFLQTSDINTSQTSESEKPATRKKRAIAKPFDNSPVPVAGCEEILESVVRIREGPV